MSESHGAAAVELDRHDWDRVLEQLRADGFSPIESIKVTRAVLRVGLGEAKSIVHNSSAWSSHRPGFDHLHDRLQDAADHL